MEYIIGFINQSASFIVPFIVLLGVLIFVHELGHFSVAKYYGVRVEVFSLGFGRKLFQKKVGDTTYCISVIPFGGYVKMFGDELSAEIKPEDRKYAFNHKPVGQRIAVVLAGPLMNAIFAFFLFIAIAGIGEEVLKPQLGEIYQDSVAYQSGFRSGDLILSVNGESIEKWETFKKRVEDSAGKNISIKVNRAGSELEFSLTPKEIKNANILSTQSHVGDVEGLTTLVRASAIGVAGPLTAAYRAGLRTGDLVRKVNGEEITQWQDLEQRILKAQKAGYNSILLEVERKGDKGLTQVTMELSEKDVLGGIEPGELYLSNVMPESAAATAGILVGDRVVSLNGKPITRWDQVVNMVRSYNPSMGQMKLSIKRDGHEQEFQLAPKLVKQTDPTGHEKEAYALGIVTGLMYAPPETFVYRVRSVPAMLSKGFTDTVHWTKLTALSFVKLIKREVSAKSLGGPLMIGKLASDTWKIGISPFLKIMAIISINLFILNLLPVPVLDGGHLVFFSIELLRGAPISFRKMEIMQQVGIFLLLGLMAFSMFNDIVRFFAS
ncbi:MAG: RIP metalloprotease RseP [Oligoflexia bacterium]|nr:RIP metalloprotease RseP [Oligoflexia bacterium]